MNYYIAARSLIGRVRKNNEDNFSIDGDILSLSHGDSEIVCRTLTQSAPHLLGVFDGMGGYSNGEKASFIAAQTARDYMERLPKASNGGKVLIDLCLEANDKVCDAADGFQMGTTCALLYLRGAGYTICNVGDSPVFLIRDGQMIQISKDHTQKSTYEKATGKTAKPNQKFELTQCIGIPRDEMLIEPFIDSGKLCGGEVFLLCSDGITDMLSKDVIQEVVVRAASAEEIVAELTEKALSAGGRDNLTVICAKIENFTNLPYKLDGLFRRFTKHILRREGVKIE